MKDGKRIVPHWVLLAAAAFAFAAMFNLPYGYYRLFRWVACGVAIAAAVQMHRSNRQGWIWILAAVAVLFNPLVPVHFAKRTWRVFDGAAGVVFLGGVLRRPQGQRTRGEGCRRPAPLMRFFSPSQTQKHENMSWFNRKPIKEKQIEAAVTVATNLYFHTVPGTADEWSVPLQFNLPDSRYKYLLFCLSATVITVLAHDEKKDIEPEELINGCLKFAIWTATEHAQEYFASPASSQDAIHSARAYFMEFLTQWSSWPALEVEGKGDEFNDQISSMIHSTESNVPTSQMDIQRIGKLALQINRRMPTMRLAFVDLLKR